MGYCTEYLTYISLRENAWAATAIFRDTRVLVVPSFKDAVDVVLSHSLAILDTVHQFSRLLSRINANFAYEAPYDSNLWGTCVVWEPSEVRVLFKGNMLVAKPFSMAHHYNHWLVSVIGELVLAIAIGRGEYIIIRPASLCRDGGGSVLNWGRR